jgi:hypothetical protein
MFDAQWPVLERGSRFEFWKCVFQTELLLRHRDMCYVTMLFYKLCSPIVSLSYVIKLWFNYVAPVNH